MASTSLLLLGFVMLFAGVFSTATTAIGVQAYNREELKSFKESNMNNFNFLVINLVSALVVILIASIAMYFGAKGDAPAYSEMSSM